MNEYDLKNKLNFLLLEFCTQHLEDAVEHKLHLYHALLDMQHHTEPSGYLVRS